MATRRTHALGTYVYILTFGRLYIYIYVYILETHSHSTSTVILLLTVGGTPLVAMQRYAPISLREILVKFNWSPSYTSTENQKQKLIQPGRPCKYSVVPAGTNSRVRHKRTNRISPKRRTRHQVLSVKLSRLNETLFSGAWLVK